LIDHRQDDYKCMRNSSRYNQTFVENWVTGWGFLIRRI